MAYDARPQGPVGGDIQPGRDQFRHRQAAAGPGGTASVSRLPAAARVSAPDITPLQQRVFGGHRGRLDDGCAHDAMFRMTAATMAGGLAGR
jgi:hypothetical protein